jgi:hypothetical protein
MSDTAKQSPLGVNSFNSVMLAQGLHLNPTHVSYVGTSHDFPSYSLGKLCSETVLRVLTYGINEAYNNSNITEDVYNNLISIGGSTGTVTPSSLTSLVVQDNPSDPYYDSLGPGTYIVITISGTNQHFSEGSYLRINDATPSGYNGSWLIYKIVPGSGNYVIYIKNTADYGVASSAGVVYYDAQVPALGNAKSLVYTWEKLIGPYGTGSFTLNDDQGWGGNLYKYGNPATQWGYIRLFALQAWQEWNYNSTQEQGSEENPAGYRDFLQSFQSCYAFMSYTNDIIVPVDNASTFLEGTYSNMNDLITADVSGVSLATKSFGQDLINVGKAINLEKIDTFGLPSNLLQTLAQNNGLTRNVSLAIIAAGLPTNELGEILGSINPPTVEQEQKLYAAFSIVVGDSLSEVLIPLNCNTAGLESLADLLNPKKLFPNSYETLTVPLYNASQQQQSITNSKTYYLLYKDGGVNPQLTSTQVAEQIGTITVAGEPPIVQTPANTVGTQII